MKKRLKKTGSPLRRMAFVADGTYGNISRLASGISAIAVSQNGLVCREFLVCRDQKPPKINRRLPLELFDWQPEAILYSGSDEFIDDFQFFLAQGIPLITLNRLPRNDLPIVLSNIQENFSLAYNHLRERINTFGLFVAGNPATYQSLTSAFKSFADGKIIQCVIYEHGDIGSLNDIRQMTSLDPNFREWLHDQPKPLGLYTNTTHLGLFLLRCCQMANLQVPGEVQVIGIDDFDVANESDPPITSVRLPFEAMGARAVELARARLEEHQDLPQITWVSGASLIGRRSTGCENSKEWDLDAALAFIEKHAFEDINVDDIRTHTQPIARETFQRKFLASTGITPRQALESRRMREARRLLVETEMSPSWIAGMCGYTDYDHFYKAFRKVNGTSPRKFREAAVKSHKGT